MAGVAGSVMAVSSSGVGPISTVNPRLPPPATTFTLTEIDENTSTFSTFPLNGIPKIGVPPAATDVEFLEDLTEDISRLFYTNGDFSEIRCTVERAIPITICL